MTKLAHIITSWTLEEITEERLNLHLAIRMSGCDRFPDPEAMEEYEQMKKELAIMDAEIGYRISTDKPVTVPDAPYMNEVPF